MSASNEPSHSIVLDANTVKKKAEALLVEEVTGALQTFKSSFLDLGWTNSFRQDVVLCFRTYAQTVLHALAVERIDSRTPIEAQLTRLKQLGDEILIEISHKPSLWAKTVSVAWEKSGILSLTHEPSPDVLGREWMSRDFIRPPKNELGMVVLMCTKREEARLLDLHARLASRLTEEGVQKARDEYRLLSDQKPNRLYHNDLCKLVGVTADVHSRIRSSSSPLRCSPETLNAALTKLRALKQGGWSEPAVK